jgi:uncharacterized DUF497 family protein
MHGLTRKVWFRFIWDDHNENHLAEHRISVEEAEEIFFNKYLIVPNKKKHGLGRFRIDGKTDSGRRLRLIFEDLGSHTARVITGWDR